MAEVVVEARVHAAALPVLVYEVAKDSSRYPDWSIIGAFEHVRDGAGERYGVGSLRIYRTWPLRLLEEVTELVPEQKVSYVLLRGLPLRNYRSSINLAPALGGGTDVHWRSTFEPTLPGTAGACRAFMRYVIGKTAPALAKEAERLAAARALSDEVGACSSEKKARLSDLV